MTRILAVLIPCLFLAACASAPKNTSELTPAQRAGINRVLDVKETAKGVLYIDLAEGSGETAEPGLRVVTGFSTMLDDGLEVDNSKESGPLNFRVGSHKAMAGVDDGVVGMRVGGKRRLIIPPELAYGAKGVPGTVPPNATLIIDLELYRLMR